MKHILMSFFLILFARAQAFASECAASVGTCDYYLCQKELLGCSQGQYFEEFGFHRCEYFEETQSSYSAEGQEFLQSVRTCLQESLEAKSSLTCSNARRVALKSHEDCYIQAGFCELPFGDRLKIFKKVFFDLFRADFFKTANRINYRCY